MNKILGVPVGKIPKINEQMAESNLGTVAGKERVGGENKEVGGGGGSESLKAGNNYFRLGVVAVNFVVVSRRLGENFPDGRVGGGNGAIWELAFNFLGGEGEGEMELGNKLVVVGPVKKDFFEVSDFKTAFGNPDGPGGAQGAKSEVDGGRRKPEEMGQVLLAKAILVVGEAFVQKMTPNEFDFFHGKLVYFR